MSHLTACSGLRFFGTSLAPLHTRSTGGGRRAHRTARARRRRGDGVDSSRGGRRRVCGGRKVGWNGGDGGGGRFWMPVPLFLGRVPCGGSSPWRCFEAWGSDHEIRASHRPGTYQAARQCSLKQSPEPSAPQLFDEPHLTPATTRRLSVAHPLIPPARRWSSPCCAASPIQLGMAPFRLTVCALQSVLNARGLVSNGKKNALIDRCAAKGVAIRAAHMSAPTVDTLPVSNEASSLPPGAPATGGQLQLTDNKAADTASTEAVNRAADAEPSPMQHTVDPLIPIAGTDACAATVADAEERTQGLTSILSSTGSVLASFPIFYNS